MFATVTIISGFCILALAMARGDNIQGKIIGVLVIIIGAMLEKV